MKPVYILGINAAYHESSACMLVDGQIAAFAEEERFNRQKHGKCAQTDNPDYLPWAAIEFCLREAKINWSNLDAIGYAFNPPKRLQNMGIEPAPEGSWGSASGEQQFQNKILTVPQKLKERSGFNPESRFFWLDHQLCHAASAFFPSPFQEAAVLAVDGIGEFSTAFLGHGQGSSLHKIQELEYPHSLGFLWEKISKFLGFDEYDACKVMGLAAYGNPTVFAEIFHTFFTSSRDSGQLEIKADILQFRQPHFELLSQCLGPARTPQEPIETRHFDIAAALQQATENALLDLAAFLFDKTRSPHLCLAGGVALNCVANRVLQEKSSFQEIYVQPVAHDAGTALGAAAFLWSHQFQGARQPPMLHPYLGPSYTEQRMYEALTTAQLSFQHLENIEQATAELLAEGKIVGWFQGRMEAGPRALGNRSLLADPRNPNIRQLLNEKVKHRENFRPFAPAVLAEKAKDWFEIPAFSHSSDCMLFTYAAWPEKAPSIPAVIHHDGTSRIQTVQKSHNPRFYQLLEEFEKQTGVPILLNTSFNDQKPIVCSPEDAIHTFLKTRIDALVLGNFLALRNHAV